MPFNSFNFWILFPFIFVLYWAIPLRFNKMRNLFLILVSYLLYMNWKPTFALVLVGVTIVTYLGAYFLENLTGADALDDQNSVNSCGIIIQKRKRKLLVWMFALLGCLPLLTFKYYNFLNSAISDGLACLGLQFSLPGLNWAIPVGISFFTFQAVGYMLDVYHGRIHAEKNFLDYVLFVSFFPQVTSGPISKASELLPQIKSPHRFDYNQAKQGLKWLLWGMFIKLVIADRLGLFVDTVYANYIHNNGTTCFVASTFYTIQIYCDFAGYSLMAIGIASILGFNLVNNFQRPYFATSVTDFWKRWHISLTRWLTQQIYIPLGGSRCSKGRCYLNILITFLVSGIWHGANWTFIIWGMMHGVLQVVEKSLGLQKCESNNRLIRTGRMCLTFLLVSFAWIFFRMPTVNDAFCVIGKIFTDFGTVDLRILFGGISGLLFALLGIAIMTFKDAKDEFFPNRFCWLYKPFFRWVTYIMLFVLTIATGVLDSSQFIYVNF